MHFTNDTWKMLFLVDIEARTRLEAAEWSLALAVGLEQSRHILWIKRGTCLYYGESE